MKYRLIVITHGGDEHSGLLMDTMASFSEMVSPAPAQRILIEDGPKKEDIDWRGHRLWSRQPFGFCKTAEMAWMAAALHGVSWVYWLEHDFKHTRPVDLEALAEVLAGEPLVAQMSLMRQPVNPEEVAAGGVVAVEPDAFAPRIASTERGRSYWLEHGRYWTTNPSLFKRSLAEKQPWPEGGAKCEGLLSIQLRTAGYSFGIWGEGEAWVEHVGVRSGFGY